jgi:hypothetical protein
VRPRPMPVTPAEAGEGRSGLFFFFFLRFDFLMGTISPRMPSLKATH